MDKPIMTCELCGAECQTNNPFRKLRSKDYTLSWFDIHNSPPHKIHYRNENPLRCII